MGRKGINVVGAFADGIFGSPFPGNFILLDGKGVLCVADNVKTPEFSITGCYLKDSAGLLINIPGLCVIGYHCCKLIVIGLAS